MRFLTVAASFLAVMAMNVSVFAEGEYPAEYTGGTHDSASLDAKGYSTVLITKASDEDDIVYIDQSDDAFSGSMTFLLKEDPDVGRYIVRLGSENGAKTTYFYVGVDSNNDNDKYMSRLQNEESNNGTYNIGYYATVSANDYGNLNSLKVGYKDGETLRYGGFSLKEGTYPATSGTGDIYLIFQLNDVPAAYKDSAAVYLSQSSVSSSQ